MQKKNFSLYCGGKNSCLCNKTKFESIKPKKKIQIQLIFQKYKQISRVSAKKNQVKKKLNNQKQIKLKLIQVFQNFNTGKRLKFYTFLL